MKLKTLFLFLVTFSLALTSSAQITSVIKAYRLYQEIENISIKVPTVVEIPINEENIQRFDFAVLNQNTNLFEPYFFKREIRTKETVVQVDSDQNVNSLNFLNDQNAQTYADFPLPENTNGRVQIKLSSLLPITSSSIVTLLDNNVALPNTIEIRALVDGQNRIVVANQNMNRETVSFPKTISTQWIITFTFSQPLRISELRLNQDNITSSDSRAVRFLAQPNQSYRLYLDPDRFVTVPAGEAGDLSYTKEVLKLSASAAKKNLGYVIADSDSDSIPDINDNCLAIPNSDQKDINNNGRGDVCEDFDGDGIMNSQDNCLNNPNRDQSDVDGDKIGDICDTEESRLTEKYTWLPWLGMGFAALVLITLIALMIKPNKEKKN